MSNHLTERVPDQLVERWRKMSVLWARLVIGGIAAIWIPLCMALIWIPFRHGSASQQLMIVIAAAIALAFAWTLFVHFLGRFVANGWGKSRLPVVELFGNDLKLTWRGETITAKVADCNMRIGKAWEMKLAARKAKGLPFGDRDMILIDFPPRYRNLIGQSRSYTTAVVGYTDESKRQWLAAFGLNDRPSQF